jgi:hypothetical protein
VSPLRAGLVSTLRWSLVLGAAGAVVLAALATLVDGRPGLLGAVLGIAIAAAFLLLTVLVGLLTVGRDPLVMAGALMVSWLVKVVVALVALLAIRSWGAAEDLWVGIGVLVGLALTLVAETRALLAARIPYVDPSARRSGRAPPASK